MAQSHYPSSPHRQPHRHWHLWALSLLVLVGIFFCSSGGQTVHASPLQQGLPYKTADGSSENPPLEFFAIGTIFGNIQPFVQHHPKVYLVFWGPKWETDSATINTIVETFQTLAGSEYNNILSQYTDSSGPDGYVHNDVQVMDAAYPIIDDTPPPSNLGLGWETNIGVTPYAHIRGEADKEIAQKQLAVNQDTQIIVFPQQGSTYFNLFGGGWCGAHAYDSTAASPYAYAVVQYGDQHAGCTQASNSASPSAEDIAWNAVHEYTEMTTDPVIRVSTLLPPAFGGALGAGWQTDDSSQQTPQEVADLCAGYDVSNNGSLVSNDYYATGTGRDFTLPLLWSNASHGCVTFEGQDYVSPDKSLSFTGKHTVQGDILSRYMTMTNLLGQPLTEETPITSVSGATGRVSYFAGQVCNGGFVVSESNGTSPPSHQTSGSALYFENTARTHEVHGCIYHEYSAVMGGPSFLGFPITDEMGLPGGSVSYFAGQVCNGGYGIGSGPNPPISGSAIYSQGTTKTHEVHGCIYQEYRAVLGGSDGLLGFPASDETSVSGGRVSYFLGNGTPCNGGGPSGSGGAIYYSSSTQAHEVHGCIYHEYINQGGPGGLLGFPVYDQAISNGAPVSYFAGHRCLTGNAGPYNSGSAIYYYGGHPYTVSGCIYGRYQATCQQINAPCVNLLGLPVSNEITLTGGRVSYFAGQVCSLGAGPSNSGSAIYYDNASGGTHEVHGCIYYKYQHTTGGGGPAGLLGFPTTDEMSVTGGRVSYFAGHGTPCNGGGPNGSGGAIYYNGATADIHEVHGCIYQKYISLGGPTSKLGFPITDEYTNAANHPESDFVGGSIVYSNGTATVTYNCVGLGTCAP